MPFIGATGHVGFKKPARGTSDEPAESARHIKLSTGTNTNGVYYIVVNNIPTPVYCIMDSGIAGGGWMMIMKATTGTTFGYSANYWTTPNVLNPDDATNNNADAKFNTFNYTPGTDLLAHFPDIGQGGSISKAGYGWTWYQPSFGSASGFNSGQAVTALNLFSSPQPSSGNVGSYNWGGNGWFIKDAKTFNGWAAGVWSSQVDIRFYGFNYSNYGNGAAFTRWGFGWNENSDGLYPSVSNVAPGSNDVSGGIGMSYGVDYSAGDRISCCQDTTGINRSARVEMYIR
jgi:hypothetical protein